MGNYILANHLMSDFFSNEMLLFHHVNMVAADINNEGHDRVIDKINCRGDVNVFINEDDIALDISDSKVGDKQTVRLGNYPKNLVSKKARYYNVSDAKGLRRQHSYFHDEKVLVQGDGMASPLRKLFKEAFTGERITGMKYHQGLNFYTFK
jgi:hypothetical protein